MTYEHREAGIALAESLHRHAAGLGSDICWLLIDPVLRDPLDHPGWAPWREAVQVRSLPVRLADRDVDPSVWPRLVRLDLSSHRDADLARAAAHMSVEDGELSSLRQGLGHRIGGWLFGCDDGAALARHLSGVMLARHPQGWRAMLRLHDPSVMDVLWPQLRVGQQAAVLGPCRQWLQRDRWGGVAVRAQPGGGGAPAQGLALDAVQWDIVESLASLNRAWRRLPEPWPAAAHARLPDVLACMRRVRALGYDDPRDWEACAWRALTVSPDFDRHALLRQRFADAPDDVALARLFSDITTADWDAVQEDCRRGLDHGLLVRNDS
ncbi:hypothetical protein ANT2_0789 [plant metagenome]|uniref:DUF4123 domain-containing protein n=1 Tax=plant metagenome TaxID=1297885 RepID=A0A484R7J8_9ZZZZ